MHAIEAKTEEMFGLLFRPPPYPAERLVGADDEWQPRDRYDVTTLIDGIGLSQLALRGACHDWCVCGGRSRACAALPFGAASLTLSPRPPRVGYIQFTSSRARRGVTGGRRSVIRWPNNCPYRCGHDRSGEPRVVPGAFGLGSGLAGRMCDARVVL